MLPVRPRTEDGAGSLENMPELGLSEEVFGEAGEAPSSIETEESPASFETEAPPPAAEPASQAGDCRAG